MTLDPLRDLAKDIPYERPTAARRDAIRSSLLVAAAESARPAAPRRWPIGVAFAAGALAAAAIAVIIVRPSSPALERTNLAQVTSSSPDVRLDHQIVATETGSDEIVRIRDGKLALSIPAQRRGDRMVIQTGSANVEGDAGELEVTVAADQLQVVRVKSGTARVVVVGQAPVVLSAGQTWRASVITSDLSPSPASPSTSDPSSSSPTSAASTAPADASNSSGSAATTAVTPSTGGPGTRVTTAPTTTAPTGSTASIATTTAPTTATRTSAAIGTTTSPTASAPTAPASRTPSTTAPTAAAPTAPTTGTSPTAAAPTAPTTRTSPTAAAPTAPITRTTPSTTSPASTSDGSKPALVVETPAPTPAVVEPVKAVVDPKRPASIEQQFQHGWALLKAGKAREAATALGAAADAAPNAPLAADARYFQAIALVRAGDAAAAERVLVQFLDTAPKSLRRGRAAVLLGRLIAERGDHKSARAWLETAASDPDPAIAAAAKAGLQSLPK
jgi:TolA-binding protein